MLYQKHNFATFLTAGSQVPSENHYLLLMLSTALTSMQINDKVNVDFLKALFLAAFSKPPMQFVWL